MTAHMRPPVHATAVADPNSLLEVAVVRSLDDMLQVLSVRFCVYMGEQLCPYDEEVDGNDFAGATHLLLRLHGAPIGSLRLRWFADFAKFERMAIVREHRGRRASFALMSAAFELAQRKGYRRVLGHAQARLTPFWTRHFGARVRAGRESFAFSDHEYIEIEWELDRRDDAVSIDADPLVLLRPEGDWDRPGVLDRSAGRPATNPAG